METFRAVFDKELEAIGCPAQVRDEIEVAYGGSIGETSSETGSPDDGAEPFVIKIQHDLAGLALSGGGIRSATFNLGLLQGLAERNLELDKNGAKRNLIHLFDYLSTVSGGGYIGSFWSAWRARNQKGPLFPVDCSSHKDCATGTPADAEANEKTQASEKPHSENARSEPDPIRHLREFSRFLSPRWGLFEIETWQFFGGALSAILPALVAGFSVLALLIWYVLIVSANGIGGNQMISILRHPLPSISYLHLAMTVVGVSTLFAMWFFEKRTKAREQQEGEKYYSKRYWGAAFVGAAVAVSTDYWLLRDVGRWGYFDIMPGLGQTVGERVRFLAPAISWLAAMLVLIVFRAIASRGISDPREGFYRSAVDRVIARLLGLAVFWTVMILFVFAAFIFWIRDPALVALWTALVGGSSGGAFSYIQKFLSRQPSRAKGGLFVYAERYALPLLATTAVVAAGLAVACLVFTCIGHEYAWAGIAASVVMTLAALLIYNPNEVGLHPLYRSRLSRAYLGASNKKAASAARNRQAIERPDDDIQLQKLPNTRPVHLICCAANDLAGDHLANLSRGARSSTLSLFGFTLANRFQSWCDAQAKLTLATAMTASAAAFNSNMGSLSMDLGAAATFLMASLNLRLGYWYHFTRIRHLFPGCDLFLEMFSRTNSGLRSDSIHLSDGGHFENLALYELLRRRCRYILASDCGADSEAAFDDVGNALRRAREDFGVEVAIDLSSLKPNEKGFSRQHVAVGDIAYPNGDYGILLLFKPTIVGDEPGDVLQYKTRNQSFPHESTGDQFYDEKQWESYRRLGLHAARIAFRFLNERDAGPLSASEVFESAQKEWPQTPPTLPDQLMARAAELQSIERQVLSLGNVNLLRDLYPELKWKKRVKHSSDLKTEKLAKLVPLFTQVLQLMTDVYVSCQLERYWNHPLNIGWVNWFGRWATTPAFRDLWPFLSPMFNPKMRNFFEDRFELPSGSQFWSKVSKGKAIPTPQDKPGLALDIWKAMHPGSNERNDHKVLSYRVELGDGRPVDVALLFYKKEGDAMVWTERWTDPDFFVPPSFWQAGIGGAFLEEIRIFLDKNGPGIVRIKNDPSRKKEVSDLVQFYSQSGFRNIGSQNGEIVMRRDRKHTA
jgi:Patatin-like phospholipase